MRPARLLPLVALLVAAPFSALLPQAEAYVAQSPLVVKGNAALADVAASGAGTAADPYVLSGWDVAATGADGITVKGTTAHFVLRGCRVANGGNQHSGIVLDGVQNAVVEDNVLEGNRNGIVVKASSAVTVRRNLVNSTSVGILLEGSTGVLVEDNTLPHNERDVQLASSTGNTFRRNDLSIASGQYGFFFSDERSYDNVVDTSNTVNGVPVRWYTRLTGPVTIPDARVELKGVTNVAQVMVYRSSGVVLESPVARNGAARGLVVMLSSDVEVRNPVVKGNAQDGVRVLSSDGVDVLGGNVSLNGDAGVRLDDGAEPGRLRDFLLRWTNVTENRGRGVQAEAVDEHMIERALVQGNRGDGVFLSKTGDGTILGSTVRANGGRGVFAAEPGSLTVASSTIDRNVEAGVRAERTLRLVVSDSTLRANGGTGIDLEDANGANVRGNDIRDHARGVALRRTEATLEANRIALGSKGTGLHFHDEASYGSAVATSNTVDGAPVRWYANLVGTAAEPVVLADVRSEVRGVTNVAQVMLFRAEHVRLDAPVAANGTADGIYVYRSSSVTIDKPVARDNDGSGVRVRAAKQEPADADPALFATVGVRVLDGVVEDNGGARPDDAGVLVEGLLAQANEVRRTRVEGGPAGIRVLTTGAQIVVADNAVVGADDGVVLDGVTLARVTGNAVEGAKRGFVLAGSTANVLEANAVTKAKSATGLWFADERSYSNRVTTSNRVNGVAVQWHTYTNTGNSTYVTLPPVAVGEPAVTNVAQIMLYKVEHVVLDRAYAGNGSAAGVVLHKSAFVTLTNATVAASPTGVLLEGTQSSRVERARVEGGKVGVSLVGSSANVVADNAVRGATEAAVRLRGSEGNRVWSTHADVAPGAASVDDPSFRPGRPNGGDNLVVDAGPPRRFMRGTLVSFADAKAVSPFSNERVVEQAWDFGDGDTASRASADDFRPVHGYNASSRYVVTLTLRTTGATYADDATVEIVAPLGRPERFEADLTNKRVRLTWRAPDGGLAPVKEYRVWRAVGDAPLALHATVTETEHRDEVLPGRTYVYAVSAVNAEGEGPRTKNATVAVPAAPSDPHLPEAPEDLNATHAGGLAVRLAWTAPPGGPFQYLVHRRAGDGEESVVATVNGTRHMDAVPAAAVEYVYRVAARNASGTGPTSARAWVEVPASPVTFNATFPAEGSVTFPFVEVGAEYDAPNGTVANLTVDGRAVVVNATGGRVAWIPDERLADGGHEAVVTLERDGVLLGRANWTFRVLAPRVSCPESAGGVEGKPVSFTCRVRHDGDGGPFDVALVREGARIGGELVTLRPGLVEEVRLAYTPRSPGEEVVEVGGTALVEVTVLAAEDENAVEEAPLGWLAAPAAGAAAAFLRRRRIG